MLHILWIIIKFILILLGILLGLILLAVLLVLFCPVRYRASVSKETEAFKETEASGKVSWLFGGVSLKFWFRDGQAGKEFRVFGLPVLNILKRLKNRKAQKRKKLPEQKNIPEKAAKKNASAEKPEHNRIPEESTAKEKSEAAREQTAAPQQSNKHSVEQVPGDAQKEMVSSSGESMDSSASSFFYNLGNKVRSLWEKLKSIGAKLGAIPAGLHKFKLTIEKVYAKINWWKRFLSHPKVQAALTLVKDQLIRLLKHIFPTKIEGKITFSCTDPSVTGTILAVLGATIPLHKNCIQINPQFEDRNMVMGTAKLRGRIYGIVLVITALKIYFNKDIKYVIKMWKKHKED